MVHIWHFFHSMVELFNVENFLIIGKPTGQDNAHYTTDDGENVDTTSTLYIRPMPVRDIQTHVVVAKP